jgi:phage tail tube protein FII
MEMVKIVEMTEDLLRRVVEAPVVVTQVVEAQVEETQVAVAQVEETQVAVVQVEETQVAAVQVEVAHRLQEAEARQQKHVSTTKTKTATGVTLHQQKGGALDCFEGCDSNHFILILSACLFS